MKVLLDANVLFPTVLREILIGLADIGAYQPLWSARILEEWARASVKLGAGAEGIARAEIALLRAGWPMAEVAEAPELAAGLSLPDPDDTHVLAAAISGGADAILTRNTRDFPRRALAAYGFARLEPDGFLLGFEAPLGPVLKAVQARAEAAAGAPVPLIPLLKRSGLPRLAKTLRAQP